MVKKLLLMMCLATTLSSSCSPNLVSTEPTTPITVALNGIKVGDLRVSDFAQLEQESIKINDVLEKGATLDAVIEHIGILSFMGITIIGYSNNRSEVSLELTEIDFTSDIIFPIHGEKVGVFGLSIPFEYWDMEVVSIFVVACECGL